MLKSAYFLAVQEKKQLVGESSNNDRSIAGSQGIYMEIKSGTCSEDFIWTSINKAIPTKSNLFYWW